MEFNFIDDTETQEEEDEYLDLSDLFDEDDDEDLEVAGLGISFEDEVPEARSITDPEVRIKARKARRKNRKPKPSMFVGNAGAPTLHGLCRQGVGMDAKTILPAHHEVCQKYEEYNVRANHICSCTECNHPRTMEELENGKSTRKSTRRPSRQRVRPEPKPLSGSSDQGFVLVID